MSFSGKIDEIWLKAGVVGSLWASVEIVLGSFLHNLRVPFAGTFLAMISVALMVAFHQYWKVRGLFWRAGLVCALMKSISPTAFLLGPMVGIFSEALLLEIFTRLLGANLLGYMAGGALAVAGNLVQKIITLLIRYGFDFVIVFVNFYEFAIQQIGFSEILPWQMLTLIFGVYFLLGMTASAVGWCFARNALSKLRSGRDNTFVNLYPLMTFMQATADQEHSVKLLFFHAFTLVFCFIAINSLPFGFASALIAVYVVFCFFQYRRSMSHLRKPMLWVQLFFITALATIFYNGYQKGNPFDMEGLIAGAKMNVRALLVIAGFAAVSVELRNPVVRSVLMKRGLKQLYLTLGISFSVLPAVIEQFVKPFNPLKSPRKLFTRILFQADELLAYFEKSSMQPRIYIITGEQHKGKTTYVSKIVDQLKASGHKTGGFLAPGKFELNHRVSFEILDLLTGYSKPLCSISEGEGEQVGPFTFYKEGQEFGFQLLDPSNLKGCDVVVVDEIGPLEMKGQGWASAVEKLMEHPEFKLIWVIRKTLVEKVIQRFGVFDPKIIEIEKGEISDLALSIVNDR